MKDQIYFFDSYALLEIIGGSQTYKNYVNTFILTTKMNLFEVYYNLLKEGAEEPAQTMLCEYYPVTIDFDQETIKEAAAFKLFHRKRKLSMVDCIGYVLAQRCGVKFLTGDKEFKDLEKVEFVK